MSSFPISQHWRSQQGCPVYTAPLPVLWVWCNTFADSWGCLWPASDPCLYIRLVCFIQRFFLMPHFHNWMSFNTLIKHSLPLVYCQKKSVSYQFHEIFLSGRGLDVEALDRLCEEDLAAGRSPLLALGEAGAPPLGCGSDLGALHQLCAARHLHLHLRGHALALPAAGRQVSGDKWVRWGARETYGGHV